MNKEDKEILENFDDDEQKKIKALSTYIPVSIEDAAEHFQNEDYLVLDDDEADEIAAECIKESLWAFNASFIIENSDLPVEAEEMVKAFQEEKNEGANDTIAAMINDIDEFIDAAISADGRGHFMNTYDGEENEEGEYFIYRMN